MLCNQYDNATGQYINSFLPDVDPQHDGRWLIPAFCTTEPLPDHSPLTWPFWQDDKWVLLPDYRGRRLYRTDTGEPTEILRAGITPSDANLTDTPRPSPDHKWNGQTWIIDPETIAQRKRDSAMAEFEARMAKARAANAGKADALAAGLLDDTETALFKAWSRYQMDCVRAIESAEFPDKIVWPEIPDPQTISKRSNLMES